jgi:hypothetical protein
MCRVPQCRHVTSSVPLSHKAIESAYSGFPSTARLWISAKPRAKIIGDCWRRATKSSQLDANRWQLGSRHSKPLACNFVGSLPQRRSYDSVKEGLLCRSKRVIPVVDDNSSHAMRIGVLLPAALRRSTPGWRWRCAGQSRGLSQSCALPQ